MRAACPDGVDVYFENVGGALQQIVIAQLNDFGRVVMCGMVAEYDQGTGASLRGPNLMDAVRKRLRVQGFIVLDRPGDISDWRRLGSQLLAAGQLKYREQIIEGLENAPAALLALINATHDAKIVVRVADPLHVNRYAEVVS